MQRSKPKRSHQLRMPQKIIIKVSSYHKVHSPDRRRQLPTMIGNLDGKSPRLDLAQNGEDHVYRRGEQDRQSSPCADDRRTASPATCKARSMIHSSQDDSNSKADKQGAISGAQKINDIMVYKARLSYITSYGPKPNVKRAQQRLQSDSRTY
jgi:hypothetical protein